MRSTSCSRSVDRSLLAARTASIRPSGIRRVFDRAAELRRSGRRIFDLQIGIPVIETPQHIRQATADAIEAGHVTYTANAGMLSLRHAIAQRLRADSALDYDPESEIVVTVGAAEALLVALLATLDSGDEVMLPEPGWPNAVGCAYIAGAIPVAVPLHKGNGFQIDPNDVRRLLSRRTKAIFINSPHNPTGAITQPDVMSDLAEIANAGNLIVISDEVYGRLYYDRPPVSIATVPGMRDRTLVIGSVSKTYAMTGWRIGWVAGPASILRHVHAIHQASVTSATSFAQVGAAAALADNQECVSALVAELSARKDILVSSLLEACPTCIVPPRGGLFAYLDVSKWADSGDQFADLLLRSDGIAVVPGTAFGPSQKDFVRLSFGAARADLLPASQILVRRLLELPRFGGR